MRTSQFLISTLKETPADATVVSHQLMLRAGLIRNLASGLYTWMPFGLRVLRKVENIVREEMDRAGAIEVLMPAVQPAELWEESGRYAQYGPELLRLKDRHERPFVFGPTHEEVITDLARREIRSYKQLPVNFYQIQTKLRDEIRPRFGIMRAREFLMKDAYSFHLGRDSLQETYDAMYRAYCAIFDRLGLQYRAVLADAGAIGGTGSQEFHVLADSGEDAIAYSTTGSYAANIEKAEALAPAEQAPPATRAMEPVDTPGQHSIEEVSTFLNVAPSQTLKTLIVQGAEPGTLVALVLRGDHELNTIKAQNLPEVAEPLLMADDAAIRTACGCAPGSLGPVGLELPVIADRAAACLADFVCGANREGVHLAGVNWGRDARFLRAEDIRNVVPGDPSPDGDGTLDICRGIEVGHIFQLGTKYSEAMQCTVLGEDGREQVMTMGCYGIGVSRVVAAAIEQNHDAAGIIWPTAIAPFEVALVPLMAHKSELVRDTAEKLYGELLAAGFDVLMDDRTERPGVKFADLELIGIPHRLVISERGLQAGTLEYKARGAEGTEDVPADGALDFLRERLR